MENEKSVPWAVSVFPIHKELSVSFRNSWTCRITRNFMKWRNVRIRLCCVCTTYYLLTSIAVVVVLVAGYHHSAIVCTVQYTLLLLYITSLQSTQHIFIANYILPSINIAYYYKIITWLLKLNQCVYINNNILAPSSSSSSIHHHDDQKWSSSPSSSSSSA